MKLLKRTLGLLENINPLSRWTVRVTVNVINEKIFRFVVSSEGMCGPQAHIVKDYCNWKKFNKF